MNSFFINFFINIARERYQNLSKEEKEKKQEYGRQRYKNFALDEKNKLVGYRKK